MVIEEITRAAEEAHHMATQVTIEDREEAMTTTTEEASTIEEVTEEATKEEETEEVSIEEGTVEVSEGAVEASGADITGSRTTCPTSIPMVTRRPAELLRLTSVRRVLATSMAADNNNLPHLMEFRATTTITNRTMITRQTPTLLMVGSMAAQVLLYKITNLRLNDKSPIGMP